MRILNPETFSLVGVIEQEIKMKASTARYLNSASSRICEQSTVAEARAFVQAQDDTECPVCASRVKTYRRNLPVGDMAALSSLLCQTILEERRPENAGKHVNVWIHIKDLQGKSGGGDFAKFRFWGLVEAKPNDDDHSKKDSGYWRILPKGRDFVENKVRIPKQVFIRMGEYQGVASTDLVNLEEANKQCHFDFQELMC